MKILKKILTGIYNMIKGVVLTGLALIIIATLLMANGLIHATAVDSHAVDAFMRSDANLLERIFTRTFQPATIRDYGYVRIAKHVYTIDKEPTGHVGYAVAFGNRWIHVYTVRDKSFVPLQQVAQK